MGRGDLIRALLLVAAVAAAATSVAGAAVGVHWKTLAAGGAEPVASSPTGYVAVTRTQEARFLHRLTHADQSKVAQVNLLRTGLVAVFLDGMPCGRNLAVDRITRAAGTLDVTLHWTRPPIGVAMCIRTATTYVVVGIARAALGRPAPTHVKIKAIARA